MTTTQAKTPRGPVPNLTLPPLKERNKTAAKAYYESNKMLIAQRRVYKRVKRTGVMPHSKTMSAMGLSINDAGELTGFSPDLLTAKQVVFVPAIAQPATLTQKPVEVPAGTVSSVEAVRYVQEHYEKASFATKAKYNSFYTTLKRLKLIKDAVKTDIIPVLRNYDHVIEVLKANYNKSTTAKPNGTTRGLQNMLNLILVIGQNYPPLKEALGPTVIDRYIVASKKSGEVISQKTHISLKTNRVYNWESIVAKIKEEYGEKSIQYLFVRIYDEAPIRTEMSQIPVLQEEGEVKENWIWKNKKKEWLFHLGNFKTDGGFPDGIDYPMPGDVSKLITASLKAKPRTVLFPPNIYLLVYFAVNYFGAKDFPYGEVTKHDVKDFVNGLRHTVATHRNRDGQTAKPRDVELAGRMGHSIQTSISTYQNLTTKDLPLLTGTALTDWQDQMLEQTYWINIEKQEQKANK